MYNSRLLKVNKNMSSDVGEQLAVNTHRTMTLPLMLGNTLYIFGNSCFVRGYISRRTLTP
jgi:hypothetical protein